MSHYSALVLTPAGGTDVEKAVEQTMAKESSKFDWWRIGGRCTGIVDYHK